MNNIEKQKISEELIDAIVIGDQNKVKALLKKGADPNQCLDHAMVTPLHHAAQKNEVQISILLIHAGANVHAQTQNEHHTPLSIALLFDHLELARTLLTYMYPKENQYNQEAS